MKELEKMGIKKGKLQFQMPDVEDVPTPFDRIILMPLLGRD